MPAGFERLTFGNLARSELGREVGAATLAAAGVEGGYFTFWKERLDGLQDEAATEIVCQVVAFGDAGEAARFVADLPADRDWLSVTIAGVALDKGVALEAIAPQGDAGTRAFRLREPNGRIRYAVVAARGRFALSVHLGGSPGSVALVDAIAILEAIGR